MQVAPAAKVVRQSVLWPPSLTKSPAVVILEMLRTDFPVFWRVTTLAAPVAPIATFAHASEVGLTLAVVPLAATVRLSEVVCVRVPETPVMVITDVPGEAFAATVRVSPLAEVVGLGLNPAVTPLGMPVALMLTLPLKPFAGTTVITLPP